MISEEIDGDENLITINEIQKILFDYKIGKKPLAKVLGWGETTIIRYLEGDLPTSEYSNRLKMILDNPNYYYYLLQKNREHLTEIAFTKSCKGTLATLLNSKINIVSQYIINLNKGEICPSYMQVLLYYIQGFSLVLYGRELFSDEYMMNDSKKPYPQIYKLMIKANIKVLNIENDILTEKEKQLINKVHESFNWYGMGLLDLMINYERSLFKVSRDKKNNRIVSKENIKIFFTDIIEQTNINNINEIYKYPDKRIKDLKKQ